MTTPRHLELFIRDNKTVAQCRTETNGRLDDPVSIAVAGPEWSTFLSAWGKTQAAEIAALTAERDALQTSLTTMTADRDTQKTIADTVPGLQEQLAALTAEKSALQAEVDRLTALVPPPLDPDAVPVFVTAVQGRIALKRAGLLDQVDPFVTQANGETQIFWEYAAEWHRNNAVLISLGSALGLSSDEIDDLFRLAGSVG